MPDWNGDPLTGECLTRPGRHGVRYKYAVRVIPPAGMGLAAYTVHRWAYSAEGLHEDFSYALTLDNETDHAFEIIGRVKAK